MLITLVASSLYHVSSMGNTKIKNFSDLNAWQEAYKLVMIVYKITEKFPKEEKFILESQMKRCVISICSNVAEGFSRNSDKEKIQFFYMSHGSLTELQNQTIISRGLNYITKEDLDKIFAQSITVQKLINGLIRKLR